MGTVKPYESTVAPCDGALSRSLHYQMVALCARSAPYYIEAWPTRDAPTTLEELYDATQAPTAMGAPGPGKIICAFTGVLVGYRIPVWSGASTRTIWPNARANYLFRAWHDWTHLQLDAPFDDEGERRVAVAQCRQIEGRAERAVLWAETQGQLAYNRAHGVFPDAQRDFVRDCIVFGIDATVARGLYHAEERR